MVIFELIYCFCPLTPGLAAHLHTDVCLCTAPLTLPPLNPANSLKGTY